MKPVTNKPMLITYADSLGGDLRRLREVMDGPLSGVFGGVHILPFFPSSGDRGFAVIRYDDVDPAFGTWADIDALGESYFVMADFMINHVSVRSTEFQDYMARGENSPYRNMFIHWDEFWPDGQPSEAEMEALYRRKPGGPVKAFTRADGVTVHIWNTFFDEQVDIDPYAPATQDYYQRNLELLTEHVSAVRFDAFAYASKRPGTSCFFVEPEVWQVLEIGMKPLKARGTIMLPEIHESYQIQQKMADHGHWVYDFALPMLTLHALFTGRSDRLAHWLEICPRQQFTTLDTHDGIGVVDVAGLLSEEEIDVVCDQVGRNTASLRGHGPIPPVVEKNGKKLRYQLMTSYFCALGEDEQSWLLARAFQLFVPGIPQIYYQGLLMGGNDLEALDRVQDPRAANRHDYSMEEIAQAVQHDAVRRFLALLRWRGQCPAFDGTMSVQECGHGRLTVVWCSDSSEGRERETCSARIDADFASRHATITELRGDGLPQIILDI